MNQLTIDPASPAISSRRRGVARLRPLNEATSAGGRTGASVPLTTQDGRLRNFGPARRPLRYPSWAAARGPGGPRTRARAEAGVLRGAKGTGEVNARGGGAAPRRRPAAVSRPPPTASVDRPPERFSRRGTAPGARDDRRPHGVPHDL